MLLRRCSDTAVHLRDVRMIGGETGLLNLHQIRRRVIRADPMAGVIPNLQPRCNEQRSDRDTPDKSEYVTNL